MSDFRVVIGWEPGRTFERPHAVLRAVTPAQAHASLEAAQDALRDGYWLAGILTYELGEALEASPSPEPGKLL
ncbi:MAG TPA: hypothetical protein VIJ12_08920, partial [Candidatus Baltobacteraceae bacterium]